MATPGSTPSGARRTGAARSRARTVKMTVTVPSDTLEAAVARVRAGNAPSLSSYVARPLAAQVATDERRDTFLEFLDRLDEELGPPTDEEYEWARLLAETSDER